MLRSLENLQTGLLSPWSFQRSVCMDRVFSMNLSQFSRMEVFHKSGIYTMDIDKIEDRYLLSGSKDGGLSIHNLINTSGNLSYTAKVICKVKSGSKHAHRFSVLTVQWYPFDTGLFITSSMDHHLKIWDTNNMKPADNVQMGDKVNCHHMSTISTQHSLIAVALSHPHVILLDPRSGARCHELRAHKQGVKSVRWSPLSEYLLASGGVDNHIYLWDVRSAKGYLRSLDQDNGEAMGSRGATAHNGSISSLRFTEDGMHLVSSACDKQLRLWDVALSKNTLVNYGCFPLSKSKELVRTFDVYSGSTYPVLFVPFSNFINMYDLYSGSKIKTLVGHFSAVSCCVFRPSTQQLFSSGNDKTILIWTPDCGREELARDNLGNRNMNSDQRSQEELDFDNWSSDD